MRRLHPRTLSRVAILFLCVLFWMTGVSADHLHGSASKSGGKARVELGTSFAFDSMGRLWTISAEGDVGKRYAVVRYSEDQGTSWTDGVRVNSEPEAIAADGENLPKIVPGKNGALYATWTKITSPQYTGDIRFSRSLDNGKTWSPPANVHRNRDLITHRFESIIVDPEGRIFVAWVDKRDLVKAGRTGTPYLGAALYYTMSDDGGASFKPERKLADHSCECCRIALSLDRDGTPIALWRHVFANSGGNEDDNVEVRDHAIARLTWSTKPTVVQRATFSEWKVNGCPHHGGDVAVTSDGIRHLAWFAVTNDQPALFYSRLAPAGQRIGAEQPFATGQASRPTLLANAGGIWLFWKSVTDEETRLMTRGSRDGGVTWGEPVIIATSKGATDFPRPIAYGNQSFVAWRSQAEGTRVFNLDAIVERK